MSLDVNIIGNGSNSSIEAQVETTFQSLRTTVRPLEYIYSGTTFGHYRANLITGTTVSLAANSPIASFRWSATNAYAVLERVEVSAQVASAITAGTLVDAEVIWARGFTASDSGGTGVVPGTGLKNRTLMGNSLIGDLRVATTAALTAGTRTLDTVGFGFGAWSMFVAPTIGATANTAVAIGAGDNTTRILYQQLLSGQHPIVIATNEGFIVRNSSAGPVTGGIRYVVSIEWAEVAAY
jgi:hypothetical protein